MHVIFNEAKNVVSHRVLRFVKKKSKPEKSDLK